MLKQLRRGAATGLIIHKIDRSARNLRDWTAISDLSDAGIDVHFATESLDFRSRGGRLTADIQAVIAADYIRNLREETVKGLRGRLKQGLYPFQAPIGYLNNGGGKPKTPCPRKSPLVKQMVELYASGQHSLRTLHKGINKLGLRNSKNRPLSMSGVETIINNPFYTGLIVIKRTGLTYEGLHEPIISPSLYRRVQDIKSERCGPKVTRHRHLYQGLFRCGLCDGPMSPELQKGRVYYRCQTRDCDTKTLREDVIDACVTKSLTKLEITPGVAVRLEKEWASDPAELELTARKSSLELQMADERKRLERLTDLLVDGTIDTAAYNTRKQVSKMRLADMRDQIQKIPDSAETKATRHQFLELMKSLVSLHKMATDPEKREFIKNVFSNRIIVGKNVELEPYDWLQEAKSGQCVLHGAPHRDIDRTLKVPKALKRMIYLMSGCSSDDLDVIA